ncbi:MAG: hypothetical protein LBQ66_15545 [Planctomycetaceae bacterium]|jgi:hypothetical protein|nr:hypothetical protein [Planctomycetaceae bacterium]
MTIFQQLEQFVKTTFKTTVAIFLDALRLSPNAQGYVSGSVTELLLKQHIEKQGYLVERIKEKWEGTKLHHGDFYFTKNNAQDCFVLESKGVKSNSEKWHKLFNRHSLIQFLYDNHGVINWVNKNEDIERQIIEWIDKNLPKFKDEYSTTLYEYEEVQRYAKNRPKKETDKSRAIDLLKDYSREQIGDMIAERLKYVQSRVGVLETHLVSGTSERNERTQATPRKDEFHVLAVDIFLRFPEHKFLFANPQLLDSSGSNEAHLKQNYIMGFVFTNDDETITLSLSDDWFDQFDDVVDSLDKTTFINPNDKQVDVRDVIYDEF